MSRNERESVSFEVKTGSHTAGVEYIPDPYGQMR